MHKAADRIRNVALVGHRGSGKTSLFEALLFEAGATNRLGSVADGHVVSDADPDEQAREMSICAALNSFEWQDRRINLLDTPGEPSFVADALGALRVCESAIFVVNAVMGVEVYDAAAVGARRGARHRAPDLREHARPRARRLLPHAGVAEGRVRPARRRDRDPDRLRARDPRRHRPRRHEGLRVLLGEHGRALQRDPDPRRAPGARRGVPREADGRGRRGLRLADGALPRGRGDLPRRDRRRRSRRAPTTAASSRSSAASRRATSATNRLLDAIVEDLPSPVKHGALELPEMHARAATRRATCSPTSSRRRPTRSPAGSTSSASTRASMKADTQVLNTRTHGKERIGQLLTFSGKETPSTSTTSAPATSAPSPSSRRRAPATGSPRATSRSRCRRSSCRRR